MENEHAPAGGIVVGVDGSASSLAALEWGAHQAELTGSALHAVTVWAWPTTYGYPIPVATGFDPAADAAKVLDDAVAGIRRAHPSIEIRTSVLEGSTAKALVESSRGAEILVVGSRGHGELAGMLLGSVSEHCAAHAHCPVLVVRH